MAFKLTAAKPKPVTTLKPAKRPPAQRPLQAGVGAGPMAALALASTGAQLAGGLFAAYETDRVLDKVLENPLLLYGAAGLAVLILLR